MRGTKTEEWISEGAEPQPTDSPPGPPRPVPALRLGRFLLSPPSSLPPLPLSVALPASSLCRLRSTDTLRFCCCITTQAAAPLANAPPPPPSFHFLDFSAVLPSPPTAKMYRNPWISNYLTHVKFCSQGKNGDSGALRLGAQLGIFWGGQGFSLLRSRESELDRSWQATNCRLGFLPSHCPAF